MTAGLCACAPAPTARVFCAISGPRTGEQVDVPRTVCHAHADATLWRVDASAGSKDPMPAEESASAIERYGRAGEICAYRAAVNKAEKREAFAQFQYMA